MNGARFAMLPGPIAVISMGMVSSVGLGVPAACAAVRARIANFQEVPFRDEGGEPIVGAPVSIAPRRHGHKRLAPLLSQAIGECLEAAQLGQRASSVPILVAVDDPTDRPDYPPDLASQLLDDIPVQLGLAANPRSAVISTGKTAFFRAVARAGELLRDRDTNYCVVAAGDSLLNGRALGWLESTERLKTEANSDGVIPGEAAAAVCVARSWQGQPIVEIRGLGFGVEESTTRRTPNLASGLGAAIRDALQNANLALEQIAFRVAGVAGERLDFMEASTAMARVQRTHRDNFDLWLPAEQLGDVGAALPACMLVVAATAIDRGYAPGPTAVLFSSSRSTERAAAIIAGGGRGAGHGK